MHDETWTLWRCCRDPCIRYCAQFYPNANCQNKGPGNPYTGDYQLQNAWGSGYGNTYARSWFVCQPGTYFMGEDGERHICQ